MESLYSIQSSQGVVVSLEQELSFFRNLWHTATGRSIGELMRVHLIHEKHGGRMYRLSTNTGTFVAKCFPPAGCATAHEILCYDLLSNLGIPTLQVLGQTSHAIILEDLANSTTRRLALPGDIERAEVGNAVALWYKTLHETGRTLASSGDAPAFLKWEYDQLSAESIARTGKRLHLDGHPAWEKAAALVGELVRAIKRYPATLNYNDFHWSNLALSSGAPTLKAIIFDYHCMGLGPAYSDYRNVLSGLNSSARDAFTRAYGDIDKTVAIIDSPLATLYALQVASDRQVFPRWAELERDTVVDGTLAEALDKAADQMKNPSAAFPDL